MILFALRARYAPAPGDWYATADLGWTDDPAAALTFATHGQVFRWLDVHYHLADSVDVVPLDRPADLAGTRREPPPPPPPPPRPGYVLASPPRSPADAVADLARGGPR